MKLISIIFVFALALLILGCNSPTAPITTPETTSNTVSENDPALGENVENGALPIENTTITTNSCIFNSNCTQGEYCINGECKLVSQLYETNGCGEKCNFKDVVIETSDKETYTVPRGQGDYTAAGALQWVVVNGPSYCQGSPVVVPINILKKNYDTIYADEVITLEKGETSSVITHPLVKRVAFTLKVKDYTETCS